MKLFASVQLVLNVPSTLISRLCSLCFKRLPRLSILETRFTEHMEVWNKHFCFAFVLTICCCLIGLGCSFVVMLLPEKNQTFYFNTSGNKVPSCSSTNGGFGIQCNPTSRLLRRRSVETIYKAPLFLLMNRPFFYFLFFLRLILNKLHVFNI